MVSNKLREYRNNLNKSQNEVSLELGISLRHYSFIENNRSVPSKSLALKIANYFKCNVKDVLSDYENSGK